MTHQSWWLSSLVLLLLIAAVPLFPASPQTPDQRTIIRGLRDSLGAVVEITALEQGLKRLAAGRGDSLHRLRLGVLRHRLGELTGRREHLDEAVRHFAEVTRSHPDWPEGWYGMALAKLELHDQGFPAKEGPYQRIGSDYLHGAADAFIEALQADPGLGPAAERLAASVLRQAIQPQVEEALGPLRRAANGSGGKDPATHMARGLIEREAGHADSALVAFDRFLQLGGDSAVGLLETARTLALQGRVRETEAAYLASVRLAASSAADAHLRSDLAWIATPSELARFDATRGPNRAEWLKGFWYRRDVQDGRVPGERLAEHYRRLFYVMRSFRLVSEKQQRATLSMVRSPLLANRAPTPEDRLRALVRKLAETSSSQDAAPSSDALSELHAKLNDQTLLRAYRSDQSVLDDRGVIYVRHGEPWKRATYAGGDADPNESWLYLTNGRPRIFHFTGVAAPATLVEQLPLNPELLASRGGLDQHYERMADAAAKYRLSPTLQAQDRMRGREAIAVGTTTDSYALRFEQHFQPVVQAMGVREGMGGQGQVLVVFAVKGEALSSRKAGPDSVIVYPIRLRVLAMDITTNGVSRLDTTRVFATRRVLRGDEYLTGQVQMPVSPSRYQVQAVIGDDRLEAGATVGTGSVVVPDLDGDDLAMGDLVLGRKQSGQRWISPPDTVELNPLNAYPAGSTVEVYYQMGGMHPGSTYETSIEVSARGKGGRVSANFSEQAAAPKIARLRRISLGKLSPGEYVLRVTVKDAHGSAAVTRQQVLTVTKG